MSIQNFTLPDVGEGLTEAEIVSWRVKAGDVVAINDVICEIETAKSLVELPSPFAGTVAALLVEEGVSIEVGTPIIAIEDAAHDAGAAATSPAPAEAGAAPVGAVSGADDASGANVASGANGVSGADAAEVAPGPLVGSGPKADAVRRRARKPKSAQTAAAQPGNAAAASVTRPGSAALPPATAASAATPAATPAPAVAAQASSETGTAAPSPAGALASGAAAQPSNPAAALAAKARAAVANGEGVGAALSGLVTRVLAKPPVRKIARDLGIDLALVTPTGARGEVTRSDLVSYQAQREAEVAGARDFWSHSEKTTDHRTEVFPVKGVRKATAKAMVESAFSAPHVSIFVDVDASRTMEFVQRLKKSRDFEGIKVSPLLILAKAVIWAAARNPRVNSQWVNTPSGDEIHVKHFMNLGIAAATPRGLLVPNIKDAQDLSLKELAVALNELASTAREGRTKPANMQGGTLTVTNIGALGIDIGTPIINPGEVAIVAFGTIKLKPWVVSGEVIPRWITTLGGSFDHRVVDGDLSARFMADVAAIMEEPALLLD